MSLKDDMNNDFFDYDKFIAEKKNAEKETKLDKKAEKEAERKRKLEEAARLKAEKDAEAKRRAEENAKLKAEAKKLADEAAAKARAEKEAEAKKKAEAAAKAKAERDAAEKIKAEEAAKLKEKQDAEAKKKADEATAKALAEKEAADAKRKADEAEKQKAQQEADEKKKAEDAAKLKAQQEAEAKRKADEELRQKILREAEEKKKAADAAAKAEKEAAEAKKRAEETAKLKEKQDAEAKKKAEDAAKLKEKQDAEAKKKAEDAAKLKEKQDAEAKKKAEETAKLKEKQDAEAKKKAEEKPGKSFFKKNDKKAKNTEQTKSEKESEEKPVSSVKEPVGPEKASVNVSVDEIKSKFAKLDIPAEKHEQQAKPLKPEKLKKPSKQEPLKKVVHKDEKHTASELRDALDKALDEDVSEIAEFSEEPEMLEVTKKSSFKRNFYFLIGALVSVMALIGFVFTIIFISNGIGRITNNTKQKEEFKKIVYPLVMTDTVGFEDVSKLSNDSILSAAIWNIILYGNTDKYTNEFGTITVPQADVEAYATKLFGPGLKFKHENIGDVSLTFYYDEELKSYNIPLSPQYFAYTPQIDEIKRSGDTYTLMVGYISPLPAWMAERDESATLPDKYMEYTLKKNGDSYIIISLKEIEGLGIGDASY